MAWPKGRPRKPKVAEIFNKVDRDTLCLPDHVEWVRERVEAVLGDRFIWTVAREEGRERVEIVVDNREEEICGQIAFIDIQKMRDRDELGLHDEFFRDRLNDFMNESTIL